jgi:ABC-type transport system involved in multi-copper enzyme maturation permease subunit
MFRLIVEKELREIIGSLKFAVTFGISALLLLLTFYIGARNYQVSNEQYEASRRENLRKLEGLTEWQDVRDFRVYLPPEPVSSLVMGVSNDIGRTSEIRGAGEINARDSRYGQDPVYAVFRFLDLDFIFQIVLSLFAILFAYDAVNGEKERGTLRLTLANAVPRGTYIAGKIAGSFIALAFPLLVPILLGALLLVAMGVPMASADWSRFALIIAAGYLYFGVFLSLSLFVSSATQRSSTSFLVLLVAWIFSVMIVPRTAVLLAGRAVDVPSVDELVSQKSRYSASLWQEHRKKMADWRAPEGTEMNKVFEKFQKFMSDLDAERTKKMDEFSRQLNERRTNAQAAQERLAFGIARVSPSAVFSLLSTSIASTGVGLKDDYKEQATRYQKQYAEFISGKTGQNPSGSFMMRMTTDDDDAKEKKKINTAEIPVFNFVQSPVEAAFGGIATDFGILALFNLVFFAGAFAAFLRFDAR